MKNRFIIASTGASGAEYFLRFLHRLLPIAGQSDIIISENYYKVLAEECEIQLSELSLKGLIELTQKKFGTTEHRHQMSVLDFRDVGARAASGSASYSGMVILPCSMKSLAAIAHGLSQNLIERAADVCLKERRKLVVCPRETPLSIVHLKNMLALVESGAVIMPIAPGYYHKPEKLVDLFDFMVDRIFAHLGISDALMQSWRNED